MQLIIECMRLEIRNEYPVVKKIGENDKFHQFIRVFLFKDFF